MAALQVIGSEAKPEASRQKKDASQPPACNP